MKKTFIYILLISFSLFTVGFIIIHNRSAAETEEGAYKIKERKGAGSTYAEWMSVRNNANALENVLKKNPDDKKSKLALVALFIQEARVTGEYHYYNEAALQYVNDVLTKEPKDFEALIYKAMIQLSQHHFAEGLATAQEAQKINPYNAFVYGLMVDANVELGNYAAAVDNSDKMVSIRPDLRSYSRIAYLREIHGDITGAIDAMKMAVEAGMPGQEGTEWCRVQLGLLYEQLGDLTTASLHYTTSLEERNGYAYALAGLGRIAATKKNYDEAISLYRQASASVNDYSFKEKLVEIYHSTGQRQKAYKLAKEIISELTGAHEHHESEIPTHNSDHELALAYLAINNTAEAMEHALLEFNRRPNNIDVNQTLAWVYYKRGEIKKAALHITSALRTGCKNPTLLSRSDLILKGIQ